MKSIQDWETKIKRYADEWVGEWGLVALTVLVALIAFGLGRISALQESRPLISVDHAPTSERPRAMALGGQFVASRTGTVYYFPWCGGAQQIAPGSQVWFTSENAAKRAGYRPAKNCRGLAPALQTLVK